MSLADAAVKGAISGIVGAFAMMLTAKGEARAFLPRGESAEPAETKLVEALARRRGMKLSHNQARAAGGGVRLGYCALWGALFGVLQSRLHPPGLLHGALLGGLAYTAVYPEVGLLPRLGVESPPMQQLLERAAIPVGSHLAFGLATAAAFEAMS